MLAEEELNVLERRLKQRFRLTGPLWDAEDAETRLKGRAYKEGWAGIWGKAGRCWVKAFCQGPDMIKEAGMEYSWHLDNKPDQKRQEIALYVCV